MSSMSHAALAPRRTPTHAYRSNGARPQLPLPASSFVRNEVLRFLRGDARLTDSAIVFLHQLLVDPVLIARITSASRSGARLGANVSHAVTDPHQLLRDPRFDWGHSVCATRQQHV